MSSVHMSMITTHPDLTSLGHVGFSWANMTHHVIMNETLSTKLKTTIPRFLIKYNQSRENIFAHDFNKHQPWTDDGVSVCAPQ